ncbi:MAG: cation transporter [Deltaproteobacteria bacterium]|nr:cation transporter [Deltaproteobacteria bacterium]
MSSILNNHEGVIGYKADYKTRTVTITYDDEKTALGPIIEKLRNARFTVEKLPPEEEALPAGEAAPPTEEPSTKTQ